MCVCVFFVCVIFCDFSCVFFARANHRGDFLDFRLGFFSREKLNCDERRSDLLAPKGTTLLDQFDSMFEDRKKKDRKIVR